MPRKHFDPVQHKWVDDKDKDDKNKKKATTTQSSSSSSTTKPKKTDGKRQRSEGSTPPPARTGQNAVTPPSAPPSRSGTPIPRARTPVSRPGTPSPGVSRTSSNQLSRQGTGGSTKSTSNALKAQKSSSFHLPQSSDPNARKRNLLASPSPPPNVSQMPPPPSRQSTGGSTKSAKNMPETKKSGGFSIRDLVSSPSPPREVSQIPRPPSRQSTGGSTKSAKKAPETQNPTDFTIRDLMSSPSPPPKVAQIPAPPSRQSTGGSTESAKKAPEAQKSTSFTIRDLLSSPQPEGSQAAPTRATSSQVHAAIANDAKAKLKDQKKGKTPPPSTASALQSQWRYQAQDRAQRAHVEQQVARTSAQAQAPRKGKGHDASEFRAFHQTNPIRDEPVREEPVALNDPRVPTRVLLPVMPTEGYINPKPLPTPAKPADNLDSKRKVWHCCYCMKRGLLTKANEWEKEKCAQCHRARRHSRCGKCVEQEGGDDPPLYCYLRKTEKGYSWSDVPWGTNTPWTYDHFRVFETDLSRDYPYRMCDHCKNMGYPYADTPTDAKKCQNATKTFFRSGREQRCNHEPCKKCTALPKEWLPAKAAPDAAQSEPVAPAPPIAGHWFCHRCYISGNPKASETIPDHITTCPHKEVQILKKGKGKKTKDGVCGHDRCKDCHGASTGEEYETWKRKMESKSPSKSPSPPR